MTFSQKWINFPQLRYVWNFTDNGLSGICGLEDLTCLKNTSSTLKTIYYASLSDSEVIEFLQEKGINCDCPAGEVVWLAANCSDFNLFSNFSLLWDHIQGWNIFGSFSEWDCFWKFGCEEKEERIWILQVNNKIACYF